jgi:membrane associated rhomboid family serine protease
VLNLLAFAFLGWLLEREVGWPRFGVFCVVTGVAAIGAAVLVQGDTGVVGISGVIFAIAGWAVVRDRYGTRPLGTVGWGLLPAGLVYTFLIPNVSIACHLGGLLAGVVLGWAFERRPEPDAVIA